ncbi:MAG: ABC transporter permease, partial [Candidatus Micrarchaeota archaeon]|nr:ABC transporter permease [Candidatus Micrarchaeota archaeon]
SGLVGSEMCIRDRYNIGLYMTLDFILIFGAISFSFIIGSVSGLLPAMQAARMKPAESLRYE